MIVTNLRQQSCGTSLATATPTVKNELIRAIEELFVSGMSTMD